MAAKKKSKASRAKKPAKRPAARKKAAKVAKKPARKAPVRRVAATAARLAARPVAETPVPMTPAAMPPPGDRIGVVTHYFSNISVAVVKLESGRLRVGDTIHIRGHTTDFKQRVDSIQVEHAPVEEVGPGEDFGMKVREHAREHDVVYLVN